jgi:hypothetical protein
MTYIYEQGRFHLTLKERGTILEGPMNFQANEPMYPILFLQKNLCPAPPVLRRREAGSIT